MPKNTPRAPRKPKTSLDSWKPILFLFVISLIFAIFYMQFGGDALFKTQKTITREVTLSEALDAVNKNITVRLRDEFLQIESGNTILKTRMPAGANIIDLGIDPATTNVIVSPPDFARQLRSMFFDFLPLILIIGFSIFIFRGMRGGAGGLLGGGKPTDRTKDTKLPRTKFDAIAGNEEGKEELLEIVDFLKNPKKYQAVGARIPRGVLLSGPPGVGKTLLAKAIAGEAKVPFFSMSGSEFEEMFVGVGASRVRDLFKEAKNTAPSIIFIDELDAIGKKRNDGGSPGGHSGEQTLNQILVEMDGFDSKINVIVIAATNRPDVLDPALLRPGRFDRQITLNLPTKSERIDILKVHARGKPIAKSVDFKQISAGTSGFSGADLENILNEAALLTARDKKQTITENTINLAIEKVALGLTRKSQVLTESEKNRTAIHELGHALVAHFSKNCDPVHKVSIVARGRALGVTWYRPEEEKHLRTATEFTDELASMLGGFVAEKLWLTEPSTGASNDIERATQIARAMVTKYGMSNLGPINLADRRAVAFLGKSSHSPETHKKIDEKISEILSNAEKLATKTLKNPKIKKLLEEMTTILLEKETIDRDEFLELTGK